MSAQSSWRFVGVSMSINTKVKCFGGLPHPVDFQAQLFSDKRFNEHLGSFLPLDVRKQPRKDTELRCTFSFFFSPPEIQKLSTPITLLG